MELPPVCKFVDMSHDKLSRTGSNQITILDNSMLNQEGIELYNLNQSNFKNGQVKGVIEKWARLYGHSGHSPLGDPVLENYQIFGNLSQSNNQEHLVETSVVVMMDTYKNWVYTNSGSLYALINPLMP